VSPPPRRGTLPSDTEFAGLHDGQRAGVQPASTRAGALPTASGVVVLSCASLTFGGAALTADFSFSEGAEVLLGLGDRG
jgi:hypothetical protein